MGRWKYGKNTLAVHADPTPDQYRRDVRRGPVVAWITVGWGCELATELHDTADAHRAECMWCGIEENWHLLTVARRVGVGAPVTRRHRELASAIGDDDGRDDNGRAGKERGMIYEIGSSMFSSHGLYDRWTPLGDKRRIVAGNRMPAEVLLAVADQFLGHGVHRITATQLREAAARVTPKP